MYAYDGEIHLAKVGIGDQVEIVFEYDSSRGWLYRCARLPMSDNLRWTDNPAEIQVRTEAKRNDAVKDYWAGFTPPTSKSELPAAPAAEDDYWAQYVTSSTPAQTPGLGLPIEPAASTIEADLTEEMVPVGVSDGVSRERLVGRIRQIMRSTWSDFSGVNGEQDVLEAKAMEWLKLGREITSQSQGKEEGVETRRMRAKLEVLKEMYELVDEEAMGFWRLMEGTIQVVYR